MSSLQGCTTDWYIQSAFLQTATFLEAAGLTEMLKELRRVELLARKNYAKTAFSRDVEESYLVWEARLRQFIHAIEISLGEPKVSTVTKDVVQILRASQYSITDRKCFRFMPAKESDVHVRIEALLRCIFPDLIHKPKITKPIKHFEPDTGLPGIRTLIEYKFVANHGDEKRIAGEVLADTRGYVSKDWDQFICVVYETKRIKPEDQWLQLLRDSGINKNTSLIVIPGEEPQRGNFARNRLKKN